MATGPAQEATADPDDHTPTWLKRHPVWSGILAAVAICTPITAVLQLPGEVASFADAISGPDNTPAISGTWPLGPGCDGATRVATPYDRDALPAPAAPDEDPRLTIVKADGGAFEFGTLIVRISVGSDGEPIQVTDLKPDVVSDQVPDPAWVYDPLGGCGGDDVYRTFDYNLDDSTFTDAGLTGDTGEPVTGTIAADFGTAFAIQPGHFALIRVYALACDRNYEWSLAVEYQVAGDDAIQTETLGPYRSYGQHGTAEAYTGQPDGGGFYPVPAYVSEFDRPNGFCPA
jgi:hypothetical protein